MQKRLEWENKSEETVDPRCKTWMEEKLTMKTNTQKKKHCKKYFTLRF